MYFPPKLKKLRKVMSCYGACVVVWGNKMCKLLRQMFRFRGAQTDQSGFLVILDMHKITLKLKENLKQWFTEERKTPKG